MRAAARWRPAWPSSSASSESWRRGSSSRRSRRTEALPDEEREALRARLERLARRREQLGPVNPLAQQEYAEAVEHVEELERQRADLEDALRELEKLIADTDKQIRETFEQTFEAAAQNFEQVAARLFPGGRGRLRLVAEREGPARVLRRRGAAARRRRAARRRGARREAEAQDAAQPRRTCSGSRSRSPRWARTMKRLSLLSGGEKSMTALAFLFAVFLARPCPFYILDEVEAALDDLNIDRFLALLRAYSEPRAVHRGHAPEAHDGGRRLAVRRVDERRRRLQGDLAPAGPEEAAA